MRIIKILIISLALLSISIPGITQKKDVNKNPTPNYFEKKYKNLVVVKKIEPDIGSNEFFVLPDSTAILNNRLFVLDNLLVKIFVFDLDGNFIKAFGNTGRGPGEMSPRYMEKKIISRDNQLVVSDIFHKKLIFFDEEGNLLKEIKYPPNVKSLIPKYKEDERWLAYLPYKEDGPAGLSILKENFEVSESIVNYSDIYYLFRKPVIKRAGSNQAYMDIRRLDTPMTTNTSTLIYPEGRTVVYLHIPSRLIIFKNRKRVKDFKILPRRALENIRVKLTDSKKEKSNSYSYILSYLTPDPDNRHIYFSGVKGEEGVSLVYKFNLNGRLICTYKMKAPVHISSKSHHRFYGLSNEAIYILKEEI